MLKRPSVKAISSALGIFMTLAGVVAYFTGVVNFPDLMQRLKNLREQSASIERLYRKRDTWDMDLKAISGKGPHLCLFDDYPRIQAPSWVCDEPIPGVERSAVGVGRNGGLDQKIREAYFDALTQLVQSERIRVSVRRSDGKTRFTETTVLSNAHIGRYVEIGVAGVSAEPISGEAPRPGKQTDELFRVKFEKDDCSYVYVAHVSKDFDERTERFRFHEEDATGNCDFQSLVRAVEREGIAVVRTVVSPRKNFFAVVGTKTTELPMRFK